MHLPARSRSSIRRKENPKTPNKSIPCSRLAAEIRHHPSNYNLLNALIPQHLLQICHPKGAVGGLLDDPLVGPLADLRHELGVDGAVEDEVVVPPLGEHAVVGGGFLGVAGEEDGDMGRSAEVDGGGDGGEDGFGDGGEVVLHVDYEKSGGFGIWVFFPGAEFLVRERR